MNSKPVDESRQENMNQTSIVEPSKENPNTIDESRQENMNLTSIVEPSKENPNPIVEESCKENPSSNDETFQEIPTPPSDNAKETTTVNFSFELHPANTLKQALACLSEEHFNPQGLGMIGVGDDGFDITVRNSETRAVGNLWLKATVLNNFKCNKGVINKWVNLNHILQNLVDVPDNDTINIHHLDGPNQLFFSFGRAPPVQFSAELLELDVKYEKFPKITYVCEAIIPSDEFREMIQEYEAVKKPSLVSVDIYQRAMDVVVAGNKTWLYRYEYGSKVNGIRGIDELVKHQAWFDWPHCEFLKRASWMTSAFLLCLAIDPPQQILLRFNLRELGDLVYLHKSVLTHYDCDKSRLDCLAMAASLQ